MAFLNVEQAAQLFGIGVATIRSAAKSGSLPGARKIGGRWYVHRSTLEKYFESAVPAVPAAQ